MESPKWDMWGSPISCREKAKSMRGPRGSTRQIVHHVLGGKRIERRKLTQLFKVTIFDRWIICKWIIFHGKIWQTVNVYWRAPLCQKDGPILVIAGRKILDRKGVLENKLGRFHPTWNGEIKKDLEFHHRGPKTVGTHHGILFCWENQPKKDRDRTNEKEWGIMKKTCKIQIQTESS